MYFATVTFNHKQSSIYSTLRLPSRGYPLDSLYIHVLLITMIVIITISVVPLGRDLKTIYVHKFDLIHVFDYGHVLLFDLQAHQFLKVFFCILL